MATPIENNTEELQEILRTVNELPSAGGGASVQTDWNQTDETQPDFLKNKPFGDEETVIVPLGEVEFVYSEDTGGATYYVETDVALSVNDSLKVSFQGVEYECAIQEVMGMLGFGNIGLIMGGTDTGEPFYGAVFGTTIGIVDINSFEDVTRTVSVTFVKKKKIDPAYAPPVRAKFYINTSGDQYIYLDAECTQKAKTNVVLDSLQKGIVVLSHADLVFIYVICYVNQPLKVFGMYENSIETFYTED